MSELKMVMLRHSFSMGNERGEFSGIRDVALSPKGEQMVRDYRSQGVYETYAVTQRYYSSPLQRCLQTFHLAFDGVAQLDGVIDDLHEMDFGEIEGTVCTQDMVRPFFGSWLAGNPVENAPHLESYVHLRDRGMRAVRRLALQLVGEGVESVTVVSHSAISRAILTGLAGLDSQDWLRVFMPNALGYVVTLEVDEAMAGESVADGGASTSSALAAISDAGLARAVRLVRAVPYGPGSEERVTLEPGRVIDMTQRG